MRLQRQMHRLVVNNFTPASEHITAKLYWQTCVPQFFFYRCWQSSILTAIQASQEYLLMEPHSALPKKLKLTLCYEA